MILKYNMTYYSQSGEDNFLNETYFKNKKNGYYIELGALDGVMYSNTKFFEDTLNWSGILIEPHPIKYKNLEINRPNNFLFNNLISNKEYPLEYRFFVDSLYSGVSGINETLPKEHFEGFFNCISDRQDIIKIQPTKLKDIIKNTNITHFDLLSLDVEGHEYEVLLSWDFSIPIDIILIETLGNSNEERDEKCRQLLIENGYTFDQKFKHNEVFIHKNYKKCLKE